ncbi:MAG: RdgB/HAM1 family non-canonical purine NTP pyrophosphatase [Saprospiraceae bacterium]|nr:RdgB/HAM1 family non-canonical purine NTP pyrophosphatase [Saprospiraceae bacterium]
MQLLVASRNPHKKIEIQAVLPQAYQLLDLNDLDYATEIEESGQTFEENALIKARFVFQKFGKACIADDSGLEVRALNQAPGVLSARYAGESKNDLKNIQKLLSALEGITDRQARFRTIIAYMDQAGKAYIFVGVINGVISENPLGNHGFGYDPVFIPQGYRQTFAELGPEIKNNISHRAMAIGKLMEHLEAEGVRLKAEGQRRKA